MKISYNWLNKYFDNKLPSADKVAEAFTFHAWEIEEVSEIEGDTVLDVKVLPDKSMWALSYRGIAKDLSVILDVPLAKDPLRDNSELGIDTESTPINIESDTCRRFKAARITGIKVGPSPAWLKTALESIGQRSINNIVDASNYVMFDLGQPSHAFDAKLVGDKGFTVRQAKEGEKLVGLDEVEYTFDTNDTVITRGDNDEILSIAGLKGGIHSGISDATTEVIVEVANWNPVTIRKTGQRLKLRTDASSRYENGIVPEMVPYGLKAVVDLIIEVAGGQLVGVDEVAKEETPTTKVGVSLSKINSVLGVELTADDVTSILERFGWEFEVKNDEFVITSPFERTDLQIAEDVIEEVGRIYGYLHVPAITPTNVPVSEINQRFYYSEVVRSTLIEKGFSEVFTSSFRANDEVKLANAFASDKGYLRSTLTTNMSESLAKNGPNADLLGLRQIRLFEIGTVFNNEGENLLLTLGVQSPSGYKAKTDDPVVNEAVAALAKTLDLEIKDLPTNGIVEINFGDLLKKLPEVTSYQTTDLYPSTTYRPFSNYPATSRDIAMWVPKETAAQDIENLLQSKAGELCVRITPFDQFEKDGRVSYAYRLAFQSPERTLTDTEINAIMEQVYEVAREQGFEVR